MTLAAPRQHLQTSGQPYCVDGFLVKRLSSTGSVVQERISMVSSYSFEWNQMPQTVTVEAYNNLGSSSDNINMTLEKMPKRESAICWCKTTPLALTLVNRKNTKSKGFLDRFPLRVV